MVLARDVENLYLPVGYGGEFLRRGHGAPVRLVVSARRGFWWVKWVSSVQPVNRRWWVQSPFPLE
ncbi:MAG: molybdopterin-dependent oxidoreductase [Acidimicrobiia bacterium]|nr:molybdopterin-dependent oxidoreductase [Acidimicrobiia bacterium]